MSNNNNNNDGTIDWNKVSVFVLDIITIHLL